MKRRVLIAVDGSPAGLERVRAVARRGPGEIDCIDLVSVQPLFNRHISRWIGKRVRDEWRAERAQRALEPAVRIAEQAGIRVETHITTSCWFSPTDQGAVYPRSRKNFRPSGETR